MGALAGAAPADVEREVLRSLRHNILFNVADGTAWLFATSFVSTATILPVYVSHLTSSPVLIGMVPALESLGWYLPQFVVAPFVEGLAQVKPLLLRITLAERFPFLLLGLLIWGFRAEGADQTRLLLILFFGLLAVRMFASGVAAIPWQEMIARVIPARRRGTFFAATRFFGGIAGLVSASLAVAVLATVEYPLNYALCFFFSFAGTIVSFCFLAQTREPRQPIGRRPEHLRTYWREMAAVLQQDTDFAIYIAARALGYLGSMATAFFAVHAIQAFQLGDSQAGVFTGVLLVSGVAANAGWGWAGDRWGQKGILTVSSLLYALALTLAWMNESPLSYYAIFFLVGVANSGLIISDLALALEFAPPSRRPAYLGLARGLLGPWVGLAPLVGGILIVQLGFGGMVGIAWLLTIAGIALVVLKVRDPRSRPV